MQTIHGDVTAGARGMEGVLSRQTVNKPCRAEYVFGCSCVAQCFENC